MLICAPYTLHSNIDKAVIEHNSVVELGAAQCGWLSHVITINDSNDFDAPLP